MNPMVRVPAEDESDGQGPGNERADVEISPPEGFRNIVDYQLPAKKYDHHQYEIRHTAYDRSVKPGNDLRDSRFRQFGDSAEHAQHHCDEQRKQGHLNGHRHTLEDKRKVAVQVKHEPRPCAWLFPPRCGEGITNLVTPVPVSRRTHQIRNISC